MRTAAKTRGKKASLISATPSDSRKRHASALRDPEETRDNILQIATEEFAEKGLSGARIDEIAERTQSSKRMIYYYFGSKDELYRAVLEREYSRIRDSEATLPLENLTAEAALATLIRLTFDWHQEHPEFVRLVMNENMHRAEHLRHIGGLRERNETVIAALERILTRGETEGAFRSGIDPLDLHINITALCFYTVSNRHTVAQVFGRRMDEASASRNRREQVVELVMSWCRTR